MVTDLILRNFRCFSDISLTLSNLTLLTGKNDSGKSSVLDALAVMYSSEQDQNIENGASITTGHNGLFLQTKICTDGMWDSDTHPKGTSYVLRPYKGSVPDIRSDWGAKLPAQDFVCQGIAPVFGLQFEYQAIRMLGNRINPNDLWWNLCFKSRESAECKGYIYALTILGAALNCKKEDLLLIEHPETGLHPSVQHNLMERLAWFASRGLQIILTTHSDHIYNGLRCCLKTDQIGLKNVAVWQLKLDKHGVSHAVDVKLGKDGEEVAAPHGLFDQVGKDLDTLIG